MKITAYNGFGGSLLKECKSCAFAFFFSFPCFAWERIHVSAINLLTAEAKVTGNKQFGGIKIIPCLHGLNDVWGKHHIYGTKQHLEI